MSEKKALKGLKAGSLFPVVSNTDEAYSVGEKVRLRALQSLTKADEKEEFIIYADDETYDSGSDYKYTNIDVSVAELDPSIEAQLTGGSFDETENVYSAKSTDVAPEFALAYAALMASGGYRMFIHPVVKLMSITVDHSTKGDSNEIAGYTLGFRSMARKIDNVYRDQKDVAKDEPLTWIDEVDSLPATGG